MSQAANQGYSHSSGIEMTSARARCRQVVFRRPFCAAVGRGGRRRGRRPATGRRRTGTAAWSTAARRRRGGPRAGPRRTGRGGSPWRRRRRPRPAGRRDLRRSRRRTCRRPARRWSSRSLTVTVSPGATASQRYQNAALVPESLGLIADLSPCTTRRLMPSLGYLLALRRSPNRRHRVGLVVAAQHPRCALGGEHVAPEEPVLGLDGLQPGRRQGRARAAGSRWPCRLSRPQDQVLRNQTCGSRCSGAGSGPWLVAVTVMQMSSGAALA